MSNSQKKQIQKPKAKVRDLTEEQVNEIMALFEGNPDTHLPDVARCYRVTNSTILKHVGLITYR